MYNIEIKLNSEGNIKDLKKKVVFDTALELYNKLLNIYKTQCNKFTKAKNKRIKNLESARKLTFWFIFR